jgi:hypothetical protein
MALNRLRSAWTVRALVSSSRMAAIRPQNCRLVP